MKKFQARMAELRERNRLDSSDPLCEGDTHVLYDLLRSPLADTAFDRLRDEVQWQRMSHQGGEVPRLVAVQGDVQVSSHVDVSNEGGDLMENGKTITTTTTTKEEPIYRHPSDSSPPLLPFSPTVREIKARVEQQLGHKVNHVLIQLYRSGGDYISEHSDKTLDIVPGSYIANVSLGAERVMVLRTKRQQRKQEQGKQEQEQEPRQRQIQRARLPHNSLCRMGLRTNARWLHGIRQDKRAERDKEEEEKAFGGARISLTFRNIGTFLCKRTRRTVRRVTTGTTETMAGCASTMGSEERQQQQQEEEEWEEELETLIYGQGATSKTKAPHGVGDSDGGSMGAQPILDNQETTTTITANQGEHEEQQQPQHHEVAVSMLRAFGRENQDLDFNWQEHYGQGFDVLHLKPSPRLFVTGDSSTRGMAVVEDTRVRLCLAEMGVGYARGSFGGGGSSGGVGGGENKQAPPQQQQKQQQKHLSKQKQHLVKFVDVDADKTTVSGDEQILRYLDAAYGDKSLSVINPTSETTTTTITSIPTTTTGDDGNVVDVDVLSSGFQEALDLLPAYRAVLLASTGSAQQTGEEEGEEGAAKKMMQEQEQQIKKLLLPWDRYLSRARNDEDSQQQQHNNEEEENKKEPEEGGSGADQEAEEEDKNEQSARSKTQEDTADIFIAPSLSHPSSSSPPPPPPTPTIADIAFWPVLHDILLHLTATTTSSSSSSSSPPSPSSSTTITTPSIPPLKNGDQGARILTSLGLDHLGAYYKLMRGRASVCKVVGAEEFPPGKKMAVTCRLWNMQPIPEPEPEAEPEVGAQQQHLDQQQALLLL